MNNSPKPRHRQYGSQIHKSEWGSKRDSVERICDSIIKQISLLYSFWSCLAPAFFGQHNANHTAKLEVSKGPNLAQESRTHQISTGFMALGKPNLHVRSACGTCWAQVGRLKNMLKVESARSLKKFSLQW